MVKSDIMSHIVFKIYKFWSNGGQETLENTDIKPLTNSSRGCYLEFLGIF